MWPMFQPKGGTSTKDITRLCNKSHRLVSNFWWTNLIRKRPLFRFRNIYLVIILSMRRPFQGHFSFIQIAFYIFVFSFLIIRQPKTSCLSGCFQHDNWSGSLGQVTSLSCPGQSALCRYCFTSAGHVG